MDSRMWVVVIAIVVIALAAAWVLLNRRRSTRLRQRFGPEYERAVSEQGDRSRAEKVLEMRERRVKRLNIRRLDESQRAKYRGEWLAEQARFVDDPGGAIVSADQLVAQVMVARGYPMEEFEQRAADISVDYPSVVENYRAAHQIALRHGRGEASTEDLRRAMVHYRALFEDLVEAEPGRETGRVRAS